MFTERLKRFFHREVVALPQSWLLACRKMKEINGGFCLEEVMCTISRNEWPFIRTSKLSDDPNALYKVLCWNRCLVEGRLFSNGVRIVTTSLGDIYVQSTTEGGWRDVRDFPRYRESLNKRNRLLFREGVPKSNLRDEPLRFLLMQARDISTLYIETWNLVEQPPYSLVSVDSSVETR